MKKSYIAFIALALTFLLVGCCTKYPYRYRQPLASNFLNKESVVATTTEIHLAKDPNRVAFYTSQQKPIRPYRVIGVATVSRYNIIGLPRSESDIDRSIQNLAASIGGDGVISLNNDSHDVKANIISFEKILL